jgi:dipeptidyl aminopeptidase/acylaminoacyl peptidase
MRAPVISGAKLENLRGRNMRRILAAWLVACLVAGPVEAGVRVIGQPRKLAGGEEGLRFMRPIWSPDGSMIAFTCEQYRGLWVANADGSGLHQLTDEPAAGFGFEWSADSKAILTRVAQYRGPLRYNAAKIFDALTGEAVQVTEYRTRMPELPHWSDGLRRIAVLGAGGLEIVDSGRKVEDVRKAVSHRFCYQRRGVMVIARADGQTEATLDPLPGARYLNEVLSPDGKRMVFEVLGGNLYSVNIDGTGLTDLGRGHRPQWALDSYHLVYMVTEDDGHRFTAADIYCIAADGSDRKAITTTAEVLEMNPSWSPDGRWIAFDVLDEGAIYVVPVEIDKNAAGEGRR